MTKFSCLFPRSSSHMALHPETNVFHPTAFSQFRPDLLRLATKTFVRKHTYQPRHTSKHHNLSVQVFRRVEIVKDQVGPKNRANSVSSTQTCVTSTCNRPLVKTQEPDGMVRHRDTLGNALTTQPFHLYLRHSLGVVYVQSGSCDVRRERTLRSYDMG